MAKEAVKINVTLVKIIRGRSKRGMRWYNPTNHFPAACLFICVVFLSALAAIYVYFHNSFTTIKHSIPSFVFISVFPTGNRTGLTISNLFLRGHTRLVCAVVGESGWEADDLEATQHNVMTCGQTRIQKQMWLTGMIGSHEGWNDLVVMSSLIPAQTSNILFPLDQHDGSYNGETSQDGSKDILSFPPQRRKFSTEFMAPGTSQEQW